MRAMCARYQLCAWSMAEARVPLSAFADWQQDEEGRTCLLQDQEKLEAGGFYLDRKPQAKHLWGGGTQYQQQDVDRMWQTLSKLANLPA